MKLLPALFFLFAVFTGLAAAAEMSFEIDKEHSRIEVDVTATMASFVAKLDSYDTTLSIDPEANRIVFAQVRFRFSDLKTGSPRRDLDMRDWQSTDQFPECVFWMTSMTSGTDGKASIHGKFILHGQTRDLAFPFRLKSDDKKTYTIDGETELDTRDFGLPIFRKFGLLKVEPVVKIRFHLQGNVARAKSAAP